MTIVVQIQRVLTVDVVLLLLCTVTMNQNLQSRQIVPGLVHDIGGASGNACIVFFREQQHFMLLKYFDPCS